MQQPITKIMVRNSVFAGTALLVTMLIMAMIGCSSGSVTPREGSLSGKIINVSGVAVADALVTWAYDRTRWCLTDEKGSYYIEGIGFGDQDFLVEAYGYKTTSFSAAIYSGQTTSASEVKLETTSFNYQDIKVEEVSATHAVISWKTSDYTNGLIEYGETNALGRTVREETGVYATTHSLKISGLTAAKTYYFKITANREGRPAENSGIQNFNTLSTLEDKTPPTAPAGVEVALSGKAGQLTLFWTASSDTDLKGYQVYRSELANGVFKVISNSLIARGQERFTDYSLTAGKKYYYRVTALDQAGNESGYNNMASMLVPGPITTEVRWTLANSPYIVAGDISVADSGKLYIDAGVEVLVNDTDGLRSGDINLIEFNISGALIASAGSGLPVVFAASTVNPARGCWQGLKFTNSSEEANTLINVNVSDAVCGLEIDASKGRFSGVNVSNCTIGVVCSKTSSVKIENVVTRRCPTGMELKNNNSLQVAGCSFVHPQTGINSQTNTGLKIKACNFLEYTDAGLISNESGGTVEFIDNLFVSPVGTGLKILQGSLLVEYNTFDSPYAVQINSGSTTLRKNLIMADRSVFGTGKKAIEFIAATVPLVKYGPNNIQGFASDTAYIGCSYTSDSTTEDVLLMKELTGDTYDYRLRQAYPELSDPWGIRRETIPFTD